VCLLMPMTAQAVVDDVLIYMKNGQQVMSYRLQDNGYFFSQLNDMLKAGYKVRLTHVMQIDQNGLFKRRVAKQKYTRILSFDSIEGQYTIELDGKEIFSGTDKDAFKKQVLSVEEVQLHPKRDLKTGDEYKVYVWCRYEQLQADENSWLEMVTPERLWGKPRLEGEVLYIAR